MKLLLLLDVVPNDRRGIPIGIPCEDLNIYQDQEDRQSEYFLQYCALVQGDLTWPNRFCWTAMMEHF